MAAAGKDYLMHPYLVFFLWQVDAVFSSSQLQFSDTGLGPQITCV